MCWNVEATAAMVVVGAVATGVTHHQRQPAAIWLTLAYFAGMETLQLFGYVVLDQCGTLANRSVTQLSYLHIAFQPLLINAFAMELVPGPVKRRVRRGVFTLSAASAAIMPAQIVSVASWGHCTPGAPLCGEVYYTVSGNWHIAWDIPYNGLLVPFETALGVQFGFPTYMAYRVYSSTDLWRVALCGAACGHWSGAGLEPYQRPKRDASSLVPVLNRHSVCQPQPACTPGGVSARTWWGLPV